MIFIFILISISSIESLNVKSKSKTKVTTYPGINHVRYVRVKLGSETDYL